MQRKILVTGGAGFIGSHLVNRLIAAGDEVVVLDDLSSGCRDKISGGARFIQGDVLDQGALAAALQGVDGIFHLAARVSVQACIADWMGGHRLNLGGTMAVLQAAHQAGNIPVIYASSAAIYGDRSGQICHENALPRPISPYAADKLACEHQAQAMAAVRGLRSVGLRFFNVYGPGQDPRSAYAGVISKFCANRLADQPHLIFGDGLQTRDFIYVTDIVDGLIAALAAVGRVPPAAVYNLCTGIETSLRDLAAQLDLVAGRGDSRVDYAPAQRGDIAASWGSPDLAQAELGFCATTGIAAGLRGLWSSLSKG